MAPVTDIDPSTVDFYTLLSIPASSNESEIRRAYRKTSRLYHPDKVTPTPETLEKFQLLQLAIEILTDASERAKYDGAREAKLRRVAEHAAMESKRRKMKEDLERRENDGGAVAVNGVKRAWSERELEIKRIAEENRRRREVTMAKKVEEEVKRREEVEQRGEEGGVGEIERSLKVRWVKEGDGLDVDDEALTGMFPAGEVESVVVLKDKKRKVEGKDKKVVMGTAVLVFKSMAAAKKAVAKGKTDDLESVEWAVGKEKEKASAVV